MEYYSWEVREIKVIFCIPGRTFSRHFLNSWSELINELPSMNIEWELVSDYYPYLHKVRDRIKQRAIQKEYDYLMWIDSDMVFKSQDFKRLWYHKDKCDIVSGVYFAQNGTDIFDVPTEFACVGLDENRLNKFQHSSDELVEVRANGMGWMLVKKGVFESIDKQFDMGERRGEDLVFQLKASEKGFKSYVDASLIVGHEKSLILR